MCQVLVLQDPLPPLPALSPLPLQRLAVPVVPLDQRLPAVLVVPSLLRPLLLLQLLQLPQDLAQEIFIEQSIPERARMALAAHQRFPHSPPPSAETI